MMFMLINEKLSMFVHSLQSKQLRVVEEIDIMVLEIEIPKEDRSFLANMGKACIFQIPLLMRTPKTGNNSLNAYFFAYIESYWLD